MQVSVYTFTADMARPPMPVQLRRTKVLPLRLTPGEWADLEKNARQLGEPVAVILREGAKLYIRKRGKDGPSRKETER